MKPVTAVTLAVVFLAAGYAADAPKANPYTKVLSAVPAAELPAKAADVVLQAKPADREATTVQVVKAAVAINPAAAPAIVGAVARAVPEMASVAAGAVAAEQPKQARAIAKAAAAAAPAHAAPVVEAVCRAVPKQYQAVAIAVSQAVPSANKEIVKAVGLALPEMKPSLERALAASGGNVVSVGQTLTQAAQIAPSGSASGPASAIANNAPTSSRLPGGVLSGGPVVGPPYIPLTDTPTNVSPGTSGEVPTGGRNYAAP